RSPVFTEVLPMISTNNRRLPLAVLAAIVALIPQLSFSNSVCAMSISSQQHGPAKPDAEGKADEKGPKEVKGLKYRLLGPAWGGRVACACGVPGDPTTYYAASASGGVWKSTDSGISWKPLFDDQPISSIGSIAVAASDPNIIYVGSGEANIRGNVAA